MPFSKSDLIIKNASVLYSNQITRVNVCIREGKISQIMDPSFVTPETFELFDATGLLLFPGFIDPHVHFDLTLGSEKTCDDFITGSKAAAFGGNTSVFDFTEVITQDEAELNRLVKERSTNALKCSTNLFLHLTIAEPSITPDKLVELAIRNKMHSIKVFTTYSASRRMTSDGYLLDLIRATRGTNLTIMVHAENDSIIEYRTKKLSKGALLKPSDLPQLRPTITETEAALRMCQLVSEVGSGKVYLAHISSGKTVEALYKHFPELLGKNIFIETAPHYLYFNDSFLKGDRASLYTVCPSLRPEDERLQLVKHFLNGRIHAIGSDHCAFAYRVKERYKEDYLKMPNGLAGVELSFVLLYNLLKLRENEITVEDLGKMFSTNIAQIFGLFPQKGSMLPGADADFTLFDPNAEWKVALETLHGGNDYDPYEGLKLKGKVDCTIIGGKFVVKNKQWVPPRG